MSAGKWIARGIFGAALSVAAVSSLTTLGQAQPRPRVPAAAEAPAGKAAPPAPGDVLLDASRVYVLVGKSGLGHEHGVVARLKSGAIHLPAGRKGDRLVFDMTSFDADGDAARKYVGLQGSTDADTRHKVNANMLGPQVLDVARHPTAAFELRAIKRLPELSARKLPQYQLTGDFTLHGKTKPLTFTAEAEESPAGTHLRGSFAILQTDFGITPFSKGFGVIGVADRLQIWGDLWLAPGR